jgi:hypothetical protein
VVFPGSPFIIEIWCHTRLGDFGASKKLNLWYIKVFKSFKYVPSVDYSMEEVLECPQCRSRDVIVVPDQTAKFIYKCKSCGYSGTRIIRLDKLEEQRKRLFSMTMSKGTKREIEDAIRRKKGAMK